jgi:cellulose synthase/poly-beta-1,6-N-acetylglucosamine synthase-like glycosyltransferase
VSSISVVIPARNEPTLGETVAAVCVDLPADGQVVVVDDASNDDSARHVAALDDRVTVIRTDARLGAAVARNIGAARSRGDLLVFADAHVRPGRDWPAMLEVLNDPTVGAVGPTLVDEWHGIGRGLRLTDVQLNVEWVETSDGAREPYDVPLVPGFFLGMRSQTFRDIGGFDAGFVGWGIEDTELCMHLLLLGYRCVIVPRVDVVHAPVPGLVPDYHNEWHHALHNILRTGHVHFGAERLAQMYASFVDDDTLRSARDAVVRGDAERRRTAVQAARRYDDDWLYDYCGESVA